MPTEYIEIDDLVQDGMKVYLGPFLVDEAVGLVVALGLKNNKVKYTLTFTSELTQYGGMVLQLVDSCAEVIEKEAGQ